MISKIFTGNQKITNSYKNDGEFPAVVSGDVMNSHAFIKDCNVFVNEQFATLKTPIETGDLLIICQGCSVDKLGTACVYLGIQPCVAGGDIAVIKHSQNPQYLAHLFSSQYVKKQIKNLYTGGARSWLLREDLKKIKLLLPDLETQNRIVEFLDKFVHLKSELLFEKEKRRKGGNNLNIIGIRYSEEMRKKYLEKLST